MHYSVGVTQARLDLVSIYTARCPMTRLHLLNGSGESTSQEGIQQEKQQPNNTRDPKRPFTRVRNLAEPLEGEMERPGFCGRPRVRSW